MAGMVYLVGAGPGDYRLISLKAVDCLKKAEVVVYDRLADDRILGWAPRDAEFIYVGKASSHHTMKQPDINQLLVDKAKEGKTVVRLKGGDPFVFGRGGEEGLLLEENGLPFEVVPGITSAISVPAYAGIPVTHRGIATSLPSSRAMKTRRRARATSAGTSSRRASIRSSSSWAWPTCRTSRRSSSRMAVRLIRRPPSSAGARSRSRRSS